MNRRARGTIGEDLAVQELVSKGYTILERNFRYLRGEIDIIAESGETLVFVEVKARRSANYGDPEDAVTQHKQEQIKQLAEAYLSIHDIRERECRFDVITIRWDGEKTLIDHIENAF